MGKDLILAAACASFLAAPAIANPNILLIIADDMGLDASNCYAVGQQQAHMPVIEAMCADGLVFDNAYSAPVCSPTRATIMTGQYGFRTGVGAAIARDGTNSLSPDFLSVFDVLELTGYATNLIGKWHLGAGDNGYDQPAHFGVSDYFGLFSGGTRDYEQWTAIDGGQEVRIDGYSTTVFTDRAIDWIGAQDDPWFLWLAYNAPHAPFHLPPSELQTAGDLPTDEASITANRLPYYNAALEALDSEIGRLLDSLPTDEAEDTVVIFIGDNGSPNQVASGIYGDHAAKGTLYDSGTHVPMVVTGPGIDQGRTGGFVQTTDLFTTIAALAGADADVADSYDFSGLLTGDSSPRDYIYVEHFSDEDPSRSDQHGWAVREGDFKLVQETGQAAELYNLAEDPLESMDLLSDGISQEEAQIVARIVDRYDTITVD